MSKTIINKKNTYKINNKSNENTNTNKHADSVTGSSQEIIENDYYKLTFSVVADAAGNGNGNGDGDAPRYVLSSIENKDKGVSFSVAQRWGYYESGYGRAFAHMRVCACV